MRESPICLIAQAASQRTVALAADGLGMVRALKLVGAGFKAELAAILHLRMAARIVQATRLQCATRELAQVQVVVVHDL